MLDFYKLQQDPFSIVPDPRFLYLGAGHREALASLFYGIESDRGFLVLTAPPGLGKTTLLHQFMERSRPQIRSIYIFQTQCNSRQILRYILQDFDVDSSGLDTVAMHVKLTGLLREEQQCGRRVVLIVDEAQNLRSKVLETIRLLSNIETSRNRLIQIILAGQPQLTAKLNTPKLEQLRQRVAHFARLKPFTAEETKEYIGHRLAIAGSPHRDLFTADAAQIIHAEAQGVPRNINRICFAALSLGFALGRERIDSELAREAAQESKPDATPAPPQADLSEPGSPLSAPAPQTQTPSESAPSKDRLKPGRAAWGVSSATALLLALATWAYTRSANVTQPAPPAAASRVPSAPRQETSRLASGDSTLAESKPLEFSSPSRPTVQVTERDRGAIVEVKALPGDTVARIAKRHVGASDPIVLRLIRELNPEVTNLDHIDANQIIRLPRIAPWSNDR